MPSKNPFKKLEEILKKVKAFLEPRKYHPEGMSLEESESLIKASDNIIDHLKKEHTSIAYSNMSMEYVEKYFGIPNTPVLMNFMSWEIPLPTTLVKDLNDLTIVTDGSLENKALARVRTALVL
ncbi:hypothetical protein BDV36DRAFT_301636 [Aspergillus pseudocaelatus]|uniref:Uncharacterized protein n=1 Tax=Aspergillus pseudocaelatus TaxID=1825620 RepID=A0ABQ6W675_9EURO|nr:hypothetical protein BDV36DRAFT_301636 [Aspergillus pseudocaelatus]